MSGPYLSALPCEKKRDAGVLETEVKPKCHSAVVSLNHLSIK
jgi:hypothetical protein